METIKVGGLKLEIYSALEEMPARVFKRYNRYVVVNDYVGSDVGSIFQRLDSIKKLIKVDPDGAIVEASNMEATLNLIVGDINVEMLSFASLVKSVNGKRVTDFSSEGLNKMIDEWSGRGLTVGRIRGLLKKVKKKLSGKSN